MGGILVYYGSHVGACDSACNLLFHGGIVYHKKQFGESSGSDYQSTKLFQGLRNAMAVFHFSFFRNGHTFVPLYKAMFKEVGIKNRKGGKAL